MIPGEYVLRTDPIQCNVGKQTRIINVVNNGDRPIQIGSHYHFAEANPSLEFDRLAARGMRLDSPAGTAVRFEPGDARSVHLVEIGGTREVHGFRDEINGPVGMSASIFSTEAIGGTAGFDPERDADLVEHLERERAERTKDLQPEGEQHETPSPVKNSSATDEEFDALDDLPTNSTISDSKASSAREIDRQNLDADNEKKDRS